MKLGKLPPKFHPKTLLLEKYTTPTALPPPPKKTYWEYKVRPDSWPMYANDRIGDCTVAAIAHMIQNFTAHSGGMVTPLEDEVVSTYSHLSGYDPKTGANDNGLAIVDVLNFWRTTGLSGSRIVGWAKVDHTSLDAVRQAIWLFGGVDVGANLPLNSESQFENREVWHVDSRNDDPIGGHSFPLFGYGRDGFTGNTWGQLQSMLVSWFEKYVDEAYAVVTPDWIVRATSLSPSGLNLDELLRDLSMV